MTLRNPIKFCPIEQCGKPARGGYCNKHYKQQQRIRSGLPMHQPLPVRFWQKVNKRGDDECWPWLGGSDQRGYGKIGFERQTRRATHVSLFLASGKWPTQDVLHSCDNPPCVNPKHLHEGTHLQNMREAIERGRFPEHQGANFAKLTKEQATEIRRRSRSGETVRNLANEFNVSKQTVWRIREDITWKMETMRQAVEMLDDVQEIGEQ